MAIDLSSSPLTGDQQQRLSSILSELTADQVLWLSGYMAGRCAAGFSGNPAGVASSVAPAAGPELTILFGSQTGNAEGVAQQMAARAAEKGIPANVVDMADYKPKQLKKEQFLAIVTSTHGEGEAPDNALDFHEFLHGKKAPKVEQLRYSVLALGDSSYEQFCQTGKEFDQTLAKLGASSLAERADCDVDYDDLAQEWIERVLEAVAAEGGVSGPATQAASAAAPQTSVYNRKNPFRATILTNQVLNGRGSDKEVRHIELSLEDSGLQYKPGDALGIYAENNPVLVTELLETLGFDAELQVTEGDQSVSLSHSLTHLREITLLTAPLMKQWAELSGNEELRALAEDNAELREWIAGRDLLDLVRQWPVPELAPQTLVNTLRKLPPRLYSISSSQASVDDEVHITVAAVRYQSHDRNREGVASTWLADRLEEGAEVAIYIDPNKNFALPDNDEAPVIMIGPGTGVAPFRAFLQEREERDASGPNWMIFGDRHFRTDFLYQTEWLKWRRDGLLTRLDVAFSRDQEAKRYVQHCLREQASEVWAWLEKGATLYVCGDADNMAPDVNEALLDIVSEQGNMPRDKAEDYLRQLNRDKRYQRDVY
jgi:sulfite reductase (NADPH) flavoprotein alpha-component